MKSAGYLWRQHIRPIEKEPYNNYTFVLQLPCGPEKVDTLLKVAHKEFADLVKNGPEQSYLDKVKKQLSEQDKVAMKESSVWGSYLLDIAIKNPIQNICCSMNNC